MKPNACLRAAFCMFLAACASVVLDHRVCAGEAAHPERPKLVVLIVIDQFPAWVLPRVEPHCGANGFRRLMDEGAWFEQAYYPQSATLTAVGHATIASGGLPAGHGIPGNNWYDRATDREVYSVEDKTVSVVGSPVAGELQVSPRNLTSTTFADEWRIASGFRAKAVALSAKDRSAILLGGQTGTAFWYGAKSGRFLSSTYYFPDAKLPAWVARFNAARPADQFLRAAWTPLLDPESYAAPPDDRPFEIDHPGLGHTFPYVLGKDNLPLGPDFYKLLLVTPQGNELLVDFALEAVTAERLGDRGMTDVLCLSLTANDYVGHAFGPESLEYMDLAVRTDRLLARLFAALDDRLGAGSWAAVLTSDHGSSPSPDYLREHGLDVGKVDPDEIVKAADAALDAAFGSDDWVAPYNDPGVTLRTEALRRHKASPRDAQRVAAEAIRAVRGVADVFAMSQLAAADFPPTALARAARATVHPSRGPDLVVVPKPYWFLSKEMTKHAAMHGTPYPYDTHVPLFFYGPGIAAGRHGERVAMTDLAPTVCAYLGIPAPSACEGQSLLERLKRGAGAAR